VKTYPLIGLISGLCVSNHELIYIYIYNSSLTPLSYMETKPPSRCLPGTAPLPSPAPDACKSDWPEPLSLVRRRRSAAILRRRRGQDQIASLSFLSSVLVLGKRHLSQARGIKADFVSIACRYGWEFVKARETSRRFHRIRHQSSRRRKKTSDFPSRFPLTRDAGRSRDRCC
jgi:hypothetical protein